MDDSVVKYEDRAVFTIRKKNEGVSTMVPIILFEEEYVAKMMLHGEYDKSYEVISTSISCQVEPDGSLDIDGSFAAMVYGACIDDNVMKWHSSLNRARNYIGNVVDNHNMSVRIVKATYVPKIKLLY